MSAAAEILSEQLARALRAGDEEEIARLSPCAACLMPLLHALGWRSFAHEIIESLPHFSSHLDLVDLRNMLVTLGYESDAHRLRMPEISPDLLPCLFVSRDDRLRVVLEHTEEGFRYFDAEERREISGPLSGTGTAYVFTDTHATHAVSEAPASAWFSQLLARFRRLIKHLLVMTALLNLLTIAVPLFIMTVYDKVIAIRSLEALPYLAAGIGLALAVELGLRFLRARTLALVAGRLDYIIGVETFKQILYLPPIMTERSTVARQLSTLKQFDSLRDFFTGPAAALALEAPFVVLFIAIIFVLAGPVALVPIAMLVIYALFAVLWLPTMSRKVLHAGSARTKREHLLMETMAGLRELKALGAEAVWRERFRETLADTLTAAYRTATTQALLESVTSTLMTIAGVAVLASGTWMVMAGDLSIGALIAVMALLWRLLGPIQGLFLAYVKLDQILGGVRTINQLMALKVERTSGKSALLSPSVSGAIRFERLSFRYGPDADPALLGVSLAIAPREFVAVVGENGSGKSTLIKLMAGIYSAQAGSIAIDGIDTRQFNPTDLRRLVAYVPQHPVLFHGTIAQNLRFKHLMASDADLERAAAMAGILEEIQALPKGFETRLGDHATDRLPSGLIHGLCLARAFVRDAPIVLLDEPGASLDQGSDSLLMEQLRRLKGQRTVVMVSHRPSHVRLADRAVLMHQGMVRHLGAPDEVLEMIFGARR